MQLFNMSDAGLSPMGKPQFRRVFPLKFDLALPLYLRLFSGFASQTRDNHYKDGIHRRDCGASKTGGCRCWL
jgi:hypothetical protein